MKVKSSKCPLRKQSEASKVKSLREKGFAPVYLIVIVVLGVVLGGGAYLVSKKVGKRVILPKTEEKVTQLIETSKTIKPTTEKQLETIKKTETSGKTESQPQTTIESTAGPVMPTIKVNFSKKGTLLAREDGWIFLWDEPGQLALNVKLKFTEQSVCIFGGREKDCPLLNVGPESYDYVSLEGNRNDGEVTVVKLEELKLPQ